MQQYHAKLQYESTIQETVQVEKRDAIALWWLGTNVEYQTKSHLFGVGIYTACNIVHQVCTAIVDSLLHRYAKTPVGAEDEDNTVGMEIM